MRTSLVFVVLVLCATLAAAVDKSNFKTCTDAGFCKRLRALTPDNDSYHLMPDTLSIVDNIVTGEIVNEAEESFKLTLNFPSANTVRVRVEESTPLYPRFSPTSALVDEEGAKGSAHFGGSVEAGELSLKGVLANGASVVVEYAPLVVTVSNTEGTPVLSLNSRNLLAFEVSREKPSVEEGTPEADALRVQEEAGMWAESWKGHNDPKVRGPQGVGIDIDFVAATHVYGIPEHAAPFSLPDTTGEGAKYAHPFRLYNLDVFEYELDNEMALYGAVPFMQGHSKAAGTVGVLFLNSAEMYVDIGTDGTSGTRQTRWMAETGIIDLFVFVGPSPRDVLEQYASVTGTASLPPMFALGYHVCKWDQRDDAGVRELDAGYDAHNIPYDVQWLDIEHTNGKRYFNWDAQKFPEPKAMIDGLSSKGRKTVVIIDPHIKNDPNYYVFKEAKAGGHLVKDENGADYDGFCWPGQSGWIDFVSPAAREFWASLYAFDKYTGSTPDLLVWNDMNEPSQFNGPEITMNKNAIHDGSIEHREAHNVYGQLTQRATAQGLLARSGGTKRPFVLTRSFFAGSQRDGAVWTGDNLATVGHLEASIPMLLSHGMAGIPFIGADVGGFFGDPEPELLTRWYQAGALQPFFRAHAHLDAKRREPWLMGEPYLDVIRSAIRLRYSYLPYLYTLFAEASSSLAPVMRPLWFHYPEDEATFDREAEFLLGSDLLVAPAVALGVTSVNTYLPRGLWYDTRDYSPVQGGQIVPLPAPLESIPILQRAGSIIPKKERARRSSSSMAFDPFTLVVALNAAGHATGSLYLDDGLSTDYQKSNAHTTRSFVFSSSTLSASAAPGSGDYRSLESLERIVILGMPSPPSSITTSAGDDLSFQVDPSSGAVIVRNPNLLMTDDWSIVFSG